MASNTKQNLQLKDTRPRVNSAGALVYRFIGDDVQVLLIKPKFHDHSWGLPKGHVEPGESLRACARREVEEETGVVVKLQSKLGVVTTKNAKEIKSVHVWLAVPVSDENKLSADDPAGEVGEVAWFNADELPRLHRYQHMLVHTAVSALKSATDD